MKKENRHNFGIINVIDMKIFPTVIFAILNIFGKFHDVTIPIPPIFPIFMKTGFPGEIYLFFCQITGKPSDILTSNMTASKTKAASPQIGNMIKHEI